MIQDTRHNPVAREHSKASRSGISPPPRQQAALAVEDTVEGCQARASADLVLASTRDTDNGRLQMERSARFWTARAKLLEADRSEEHRVALRAEWDAGDG